MLSGTDSVRQFMQEAVPLKRWKFYALRFCFFAFGFIALISLVDIPVHAAAAVLARSTYFALFMSIWLLIAERGSKRTRLIATAGLVLLSILVIFMVFHAATTR